MAEDQQASPSAFSAAWMQVGNVLDERIRRQEAARLPLWSYCLAWVTKIGHFSISQDVDSITDNNDGCFTFIADSKFNFTRIVKFNLHSGARWHCCCEGPRLDGQKPWNLTQILKQDLRHTNPFTSTTLEDNH